MIGNVLTALAIVLSTVAVQASQPTSSETVYVALGDSIAAGIGSSLPRERSYPALLGRLMAGHLEAPVRVENLARPGESAGSFLTGEQLGELESLITDLGRSGAVLQAVTLSLGGNEVLDVRDAPSDERDEALASFRSAFPDVLAAVRETAGDNVPIYASTVYDPTGGDPSIELTGSWWIEQFNTVIRETAADFGVLVVDLAREFAASARELTRYPADVHPTNEGHARIAAAHWKATGIDTQPPEIEVLSNNSPSRYTPTVRFQVSEATVSESLSVTASNEEVTVYGPLEVDELEYALLIDASDSRPESLELTISVADAAGNGAEVDTELVFDISR